MPLNDWWITQPPPQVSPGALRRASPSPGSASPTPRPAASTWAPAPAPLEPPGRQAVQVFELTNFFGFFLFYFLSFCNLFKTGFSQRTILLAVCSCIPLFLFLTTLLPRVSSAQAGTARIPPALVRPHYCCCWIPRSAGWQDRKLPDGGGGRRLQQGAGGDLRHRQLHGG